MAAATEHSNVTSTDQETTIVSVNDLIIGRKIEFPLYDINGILLLAENSTITREIKEAVSMRGNAKVRVSNQDLSRVTFTSDAASHGAASISFDTELTSKIDAIVDAGLLSVKNEGAAVKEEVVYLGRKGYDKEQRERLVEKNQENGEALDSMISGALHGKPLDGKIVSVMAAQYLNEMTLDTENVLTSAISSFEEDDIGSRSLEVGLLAMAIGIEMDLNAENSRHLAMAGLVHDWGMMKVPKEIRMAQRRLSQVEMLEIKRHPIHSLELLQNVSALPRVIPVIAYQVHERLNGQGYPRGRCGKSIHPLARILQVADAFVGMTSPRPYRAPLTRYAAMECLLRQARDKYVDPDVVRALLRIQTLFGLGSFVALSDGSVAQIIRRRENQYTKPDVSRLQDAEGTSVDANADENIIDLSATEELVISQAVPTPGREEFEYSQDVYTSILQQPC